MVPTETLDGGVFAEPSEGKLVLNQYTDVKWKDCKYQEIYILSADEIKANDWCIINTHDQEWISVLHHIKEIKNDPFHGKVCILHNDEGFIYYNECTKIIASTNKSITPNFWINLKEQWWIFEHYNKHKELPEIELQMVNIGALKKYKKFVIKRNSDKSVIIVEPVNI